MTNKKVRKGGHCPKHLKLLKSKMIGGTVGVKPYQRYNNGGSDRQAALDAGRRAAEKHTKAIQASRGGKRKNLKTRKLKRNKKRKPRKTRKHTRHKKTIRKNKMRKKRKNTKKYRKHKKRGGSSICGSDTKLPVPTFNSPGTGKVGPVTADSLSAGGNSSNLNASCQAANDCYATGTCSGGGKKEHFLNWYEAYPTNNFGRQMTGYHKEIFIGGRDRFPHTNGKISGSILDRD